MLRVSDSIQPLNGCTATSNKQVYITGFGGTAWLSGGENFVGLALVLGTAIKHSYGFRAWVCPLMRNLSLLLLPGLRQLHSAVQQES